MVPRTRERNSKGESTEQRSTSSCKKDNATQEWLNYKNKMGSAITQIYPLSKKQTHTAEHEWVTKVEQWGDGQEIRQLDHAYEKEPTPNKKYPDATRSAEPKEKASD